ncbi:MAG: heavy metal translocating P-type ATPase, partial [Gaiellaceae bacterium]
MSPPTADALDGLVSGLVDGSPERAVVEIADLIGAVEAAGYGAALAHQHEHGDDPSGLRLRLMVSLALSAPLAALAMLPPLEFGGWEWLALALATPVVLWSGWGF